MAGNSAVMKHLLKQENILNTNKLDMKAVSVGGVYLSDFPVPWCNLSPEHMIYVDVSHNWISEIPEQISRLVDLQFFDVSHNRLVRLPDTICVLTKILDLFLSHNRLLYLPEESTRLQRLRTLDIEDTYVGTPPADGKVARATGQVCVCVCV